jgi:hypothetical protein
VSRVFFGDQLFHPHLEGIPALGDGQKLDPVQACHPPRVVTKLVAERRVVLDRAVTVDQTRSFGLGSPRPGFAPPVELFPELGTPFFQRSLDIVQTLRPALAPSFACFTCDLSLFAPLFARRLVLIVSFVTCCVARVAPLLTLFVPLLVPRARRGLLSGHGERDGTAEQQAPRAEPTGGLHALPPGERRQDGITLLRKRKLQPISL